MHVPSIAIAMRSFIRGAAAMLLALACALTTLPVRANQVVMVPESELGAFAIGRGIGRSVAGAVNAAGEARRNANEFSKEIAEVRRQFWQAYPDKPEFAELDKKFFSLLQSKDFFYMAMAVAEGPGSPSFRLSERVAGVDRGIRPKAQDEFNTWVREIRRRMGARVDGAMVWMTTAKLRKAIDASDATYKRYRLVRDQEELAASGVAPAKVAAAPSPMPAVAPLPVPVPVPVPASPPVAAAPSPMPAVAPLPVPVPASPPVAAAEPAMVPAAVTTSGPPLAWGPMAPPVASPPPAAPAAVLPALTAAPAAATSQRVPPARPAGRAITGNAQASLDLARQAHQRGDEPGALRKYREFLRKTEGPSAERSEAERAIISLGRRWGTIAVHCQRAGMTLTIDGRPARLNQVTDVKVGAHTVVLSGAGVKTVTRQIQVNAGAAQTLSFD